MIKMIKIGQRLSKCFITDKGLRQGCWISPKLFKICVEEALKIRKENCRGIELNVNGTSIFILQFANDRVIIAKQKTKTKQKKIQRK